MTAPWHKAIRDFWRERTRTVLVVLAIALGIGAFTAVLSTYAILTRELNRQYLATNPASATLRTDHVDDQLVAAVLANHEVGAAEARRVVSGRIRGPAGWRNLELFVVKDFGDIRVSRLVPQRGAWPPAAGEILIERDAMQVAGIRIGDQVTARTASGKASTLLVSGTVHDVGKAQARMENIVYGYVTLDTLARLGEGRYLDQLNILVAADQFDERHIRDVAADVKQLMEKRGHPVGRIDVPTPGKHPHAAIMGLLLMVMALFGLLVLALSGVIVVNLLTALMASQIRQIGMMKAIGGTTAQIARIYLGQALLLGVAAIVIAVPAGIWGGRALCRYMAVFLNFDINSFSIPAWVFLLVALVGLVVPLLAAAYPVLKGSGISVRDALTDFGVSRNHFGMTAFDRRLAGMGGAGRPILLAMRNSFRRRVRLAFTLGTLAAGGLFFMSALNIRASMINTLDRLFAGKKYDLGVSIGEMVPIEWVESAIRKTPGISRSEGWIAVGGSIANAKQTPAAGGGAAALHAAANASSNHGGDPRAAHMHEAGALGADRFTVIAIPTGTSFQQLQIIDGRDLRPGETGEIVVNNALAAQFPQLKVGRTVKLAIGSDEASWRVVGIAREPFSPAIAYVPLAYLEEFHPRMTNNVRIALTRADPASIDRVKASLEQNLHEEGIQARDISSKADSRFGFDEHMLMIYIFLIVMSCVIGCVGALGLMTTLSLNVLERRREMGVMRAIGASPWAISLIVVAEGVVIGVMSWGLAALAAWPVSKGLGDALVNGMFRSGLDFSFEWRGLVIWLAVCVSSGALASFLPAWNASRSPVREALGYE